MSNRGRHKKSKQHLVIRILGKTIANRMMECQKNCGNTPNLDVFLNYADWCNVSNNLSNHPLYKKYKNGRS